MDYVFDYVKRGQGYKRRIDCTESVFKDGDMTLTVLELIHSRESELAKSFHSQIGRANV